jgi:3',5'-cyclic AMP phosphodiesterase CpdA
MHTRRFVLRSIALTAAASFDVKAAARATFTVADGELSSPPRLIAYGDTRFTDPSEHEATDPKVRRWLVEQVAAEKPDAILVSGDLPWKGGQKSDYAVFHSESEIWRRQHLRVYPALGNHELNGGVPEGLENWWDEFPALRSKRWYSVQLGSRILVLNLDSNSSLLAGDEQAHWIASQLAAMPASTRFVLFNLHHPPVSDFQPHGDQDHNARPNEIALADFLKSAPERAQVRFVVVAGHVHNYERYFQDGTVYLVSGGGGAKPRPIDRTPGDLYQDRDFPNYHYLKFVLAGDALQGQMYRVKDPAAAVVSWQLKDQFTVDAIVSK